MSDPTDQYFCTSLGFFENQRKLHLGQQIAKFTRVKIPVSVVANFLPPVLWCYASVNQRNGNLSGYSDEDFQQIFKGKGLDLPLPTVKKLVKALRASGFIESNGQLHSYKKYNKFFPGWQQRHAIRERWRKQKEKERKEAEAKAKEEAKSKTNGNGKHLTPTQRLYAVNQQLESAQGEERKKLLKLRKQIQTEITGIEKDKPQSRQEHPAAPEQSQEEIDREFLKAARAVLKETPDGITPRMFFALHDAGDHLSPAIKKKFASALERRGEARNPVPG